MTDSAAVSDWNVGRSPDARALSCLRNHGIETAHKARQVEESIFSFLFIPMLSLVLTIPSQKSFDQCMVKHRTVNTMCSFLKGSQVA